MTDLGEHRVQLKKYLKIAPIGNLLDFTSSKMKDVIQSDIDKTKPDIIIIDSLSMAVSQSLVENETAFKFNAVVKAIRKNAKCAVITVHHSKKSQVGKKMAGDMDDLYGSRFITAEADFVITFLPQFDQSNPESNEVTSITAVNTKIRLGRWRPPVSLYRTEQLDFMVEEYNAAIPGFGKRNNSSGDFEEVIFRAASGD